MGEVLTFHGAQDGVRFGLLEVRGRRISFHLDRLSGRIDLWRNFDRRTWGVEPEPLTDRRLIAEATALIRAYDRAHS